MQKKGDDCTMGKPRKIKSISELEKLWIAYKAECDNQMVLTHEFSAKNSEFVSKELKRAITYTIEGFCVYIGIARSTFYDRYANDSDYMDIVTRIRDECELDARKKFELGMIPTQLSGLWMSKHGYTHRTETSVDDSKALETLVNAMHEGAKAVQGNGIQP